MNFRYNQNFLFICSALASTLLLSLPSCLLSQYAGSISTSPIGIPFIKNYTPEEYNAHNQNWAIVQDKRGVMYFGNGSGILEYDGANWRLIPTEIIRSLAVDKDGRIYVGSFNDLGYLGPDSVNQLQFVSLLSKIDTQYHDFKDVWETRTTRSGLYFMSYKYIFRWDGSQMSVWNTPTNFSSSFKVNDDYYFQQMNVGLMQIKSDSLVLAPAGEKFNEIQLIFAIPFGSGVKKQMLIGTRTELWLYDFTSLRPFPTSADAILRDGQITCGRQINPNRYAIGTMQNGIAIIDEHGQLLQHLNKSSGLQDETIWSLYSDQQGNLWSGMHLGISRMEIGSTLTEFTEREGLEGSVVDIARKDDILYAATTMGTYYLEDKKSNQGAPSKFKRVNGVPPQSWGLLPYKDFALVGTYDGIFEIHRGNGKLINDAYTMLLHKSRQDTNRVIAGLYTGLSSLYHKNGKWIDEGIVEGIKDEITSIVETEDHQYWVGTRYNGLFSVDFSKGFTLKPKVVHYDTLNGLPAPPENRVTAFMTSRGLRYATMKGIVYFDEKKQYFFPDTTLIKGLSNDSSQIYTIKTDRHKNLWMVAAPITGVARLQADGSYLWEADMYLRLKGTNDYEEYPDPLHDGITWLGCDNRVIRYDASMKKDTSFSFTTLIRQIKINDDSILYGGAGTGLNSTLILTNAAKSIRFSYAAPTFDDESKTVYQHMLEGYDTEWSNWNTETYTNYSRLPAGTYRFMVMAKNIYQQIGETASIEFQFIPPFYRTWWAYIIYAILLIGMLFLLWQKQLARLRQKHLRELKILEYDKLKELDQLKSRFFADISHEFRTPLTLILGPVENALSTKPDNEFKGQFQMIKRNAQRLLRLINQLLDLSKLEAGKMKLELIHEDILPVINGMVHSFESLAQSKKIELGISKNIESAHLDFDRGKMEQVLTNLISNAVKFTPPGGRVTVKVSKNEQEHLLEIEVADTGPGISTDQMPHVFDRFYQGDEAAKSGEPGTGIGLALSKQLIELHQGTIQVKNDEQGGATFTVKLPLRKTKLHSQQVSSKEIKMILPDEESIAAAVNLITDQDLASDNTLLLVEDNMDMRAFIREMLSGTYAIIEAVDGQDGVEKAFEIIPDIIISDVMMPRKDGLELCGILKNDERTSHIPIILLTAKADIESRLAGLERGADEYLAKPFNRDELLIRSKNLLDLRQRLRTRYSSLQIQEPAVEEDVRIEDVFVQKIRLMIEENLSDSELEIEQLSRMAGMSRSQLFRKLKALTGQAPSLFIRNIRLHKAKELLQTTQMNMSEVAYTVGFTSPGYFSDSFTETFGFRPTQLKK